MCDRSCTPPGPSQMFNKMAAYIELPPSWIFMAHSLRLQTSCYRNPFNHSRTCSMQTFHRNTSVIVKRPEASYLLPFKIFIIQDMIVFYWLNCSFCRYTHVFILLLLFVFKDHAVLASREFNMIGFIVRKANSSVKCVLCMVWWIMVILSPAGSMYCKACCYCALCIIDIKMYCKVFSV